MPIDSKECFAALTEDGQLWEIYQAAQSGGGVTCPIDGTCVNTASATGDCGAAKVQINPYEGIYYPLYGITINGKPVYKVNQNRGIFYENDAWHIYVGAPITADIVESSDPDSANFPWLSAWSGDVDIATLTDVICGISEQFLFAGASAKPTGAAGGDLTGTYPNPTVDGLQGNPVSNAVPVNGQVLQFDGTSWVPGAIPSGGSGGGGVVYFLNFNTAADAPVTNIPQTPNASKELGITAETTATSFTSAILSTASYDFLASFVTDLNVPSATAIPAGVWDFNIWAESSTANASNHVLYKIEVLKYDGVNAPVLLATSVDSYIYDPQDITQYVSSVVLPQTTILATDRIVVYLYGRATQNNNTITFHFGDGYPTHVHSTMPSVTGTGVVKVVNGVFQSPASTIVNSDVSASAAIDVSKLAMSTNRLLGRTTAGTGAVEEITVGTGLSLTAGTLTNTVSAGVTSVTATAPLTSSGGATPDISTSIATNRIVGRSTAGTGVMEELTPVGITVSAGNITGIGGTVGTVDNAVPRADGTGGFTLQSSPVSISDVNTSLQTTVAIGPDRTTFSITGDAGTDVITATGHNFVTNQAVSFPTLTGGSGLNTFTRYFVRDVTASTFKVSTTIGGGAIDFTTNITAGTVQSSASLVLLQGSQYGLESIQTAIPDGTAVGGNARGMGAVDLSMYRAAAADVASGSNSFVGPGYAGRAAGGWSAAIACYDTQATGQYSFAAQRNAIASSQYSTAIGYIARAQTSDGAAAVGGFSNTSSGARSGVFGGEENEANNSYSGTLAGYRALSNRYGMHSHAAGQFSAKGDAQRARFVLRCKTTTNAAVEMALDGGTTYLGIPSGKVIACTINISGVKSDGSAVAHYVRQYAVKNVGGTSSEVYAPVTIGTDNAAGTVIALSANNTDDTLRIAVTGIASETWRWVASVDAVEIAYGT